MKNFNQLGLPENLVRSLEGMKITTPTPIQTAAIPPALEGHDILASAQTGTGKTVAYSIPLIIKLQAGKGSALILTPTRELALQVQQTLNQILGSSSFKTILLIGGSSMSHQMKELKKRPSLIIGTPGRISDHLQRGSLSLRETGFLILDEADRMLDMGFETQLEKITQYLPRDRQTMMFSATVPPNIERLSKKYLRDPERITIGSSIQPAPKIKQEIMHIASSEKFSQLTLQLDKREGSILVFVKTRRGADRLSKELTLKGYSSAAIHGDLPQRKREKVILAFRNGKNRIMVATDVAARGLDIPHIMHVINHDLPQCPEDYIHRIGRTGRAGAEGHALCLITPEDKQKWRAICRLMDPQSIQKTESKSPQKFKPRHRFSRRPKRSRNWKLGS